MSRYKRVQEWAGNSIVQSVANLAGVGVDTVATVTPERTDLLRTMRHQEHGLVRIEQMPSRGWLEKIKVVKTAGSCTDFEVFVFDRGDGGEDERNIIWRSRSVLLVSQELKSYSPSYGGYPGYYIYTETDRLVLEVVQIGIPFECRADLIGGDDHQLWIKVKPDAGADNDFWAEMIVSPSN